MCLSFWYTYRILYNNVPKYVEVTVLRTRKLVKDKYVYLIWLIIIDRVYWENAEYYTSSPD